MEFLGKDGIPVPRLRDSVIESNEEYGKIYMELLR